MKKKFLAALLVCLCIVSLLPVGAFAEDAPKYTVTVQADAEEYSPGDTVNVTLTITAPEGAASPTLGAYEFVLAENDEDGLLTRGEFTGSFANLVKNDDSGAVAAAMTVEPFCTGIGSEGLVLGSVSYTVSDAMLTEDAVLSVGITDAIFAYDSVSGKDAELAIEVVSVPFTVKRSCDYEFRVTVADSAVQVGDLVVVSEALFGPDDTSNSMAGLTSWLYYDTEYFEFVSSSAASGFDSSHITTYYEGKPVGSFSLNRVQQSGFAVAQGAEIGSVTLRAIKATDDAASEIFVSGSSSVSKIPEGTYVCTVTPASVTVAAADGALIVTCDSEDDVVTIMNLTESSIDVYVYIAQYDANGKMLCVSISDAQRVSGFCGTAEVELPEAVANAATTKVMVLDSAFAPLCPATVI